MIPFIGGYITYNQDQDVKEALGLVKLFGLVGNPNVNIVNNMFANQNVKNMMNMFRLWI